MPAYQTNRMRFNSTRYKRKATSAPYPRKKARVVSQRPVPGAFARMTVGIPRPQEVKVQEINVNHTGVSGGWQFIGSTGYGLMGSIVQGTDFGNRIGRDIRVVGIVYRLSCISASGTAGSYDPLPYTVDMLWDSQSNGQIPNIANIYQTTVRTALTNPEFEDRYTFIKRCEVRDPQQRTTTLSGMIKTNRLVSYVGSGATPDPLGVLSVLKNNFLITCSSADSTPTFVGTIRVLYVDA